MAMDVPWEKAMEKIRKKQETSKIGKNIE